MTDFSKELIGFAKEFFKPIFAFCLSATCLLAYLFRQHSEFGESYKSGGPAILFLGVLFFLIWAIQSFFVVKSYCEATTAETNRKKHLAQLLQRLSPLESYVLAKQLSKGCDTGDFIFGEYRAAIQTLDAKGLVRSHNDGGPSRITITILPETWNLLEADKLAFIARSNSLNSEKQL